MADDLGFEVSSGVAANSSLLPGWQAPRVAGKPVAGGGKAVATLSPTQSLPPVNGTPSIENSSGDEAIQRAIPNGKLPSSAGTPCAAKPARGRSRRGGVTLDMHGPAATLSPEAGRADGDQPGKVPQRYFVSIGISSAQADGESGQKSVVHQIPAAALANTILSIKVHWRQRQAWHRAEKSLTLQAKAMCRGLAIEGDKKEADVIYQAAIGKGEHPRSEIAFAAIFPLLEGRKPIEANRKAIEKRLAKLAAELPVSAWAMEIRGFALPSLAAIIGESGDLSLYANPAKLWKRMGLAVMPDGKAQRRVAGEAAIAHGYSPARRSVVWNVGACLLRSKGPLKEIYDQRKEYELARGISKIAAHKRAQRYMEKRFLLLLWRAWRQAGVMMSPDVALPAANCFEAVHEFKDAAE